MTTAELQHNDTATHNPTRMVHVATDDTFTVALCGAKLVGVRCPGAPIDCHVCAELHRAELDAVLREMGLR